MAVIWMDVEEDERQGIIEATEGNGVGRDHLLFPPHTSGSVDNTRAALHFANAAKAVVMHPQVWDLSAACLALNLRPHTMVIIVTLLPHQVNEVADDKAVIRAMQAEIEALKRQLVGV